MYIKSSLKYKIFVCNNMDAISGALKGTLFGGSPRTDYLMDDRMTRTRDPVPNYEGSYSFWAESVTKGFAIVHKSTRNVDPL